MKAINRITVVIMPIMILVLTGASFTDLGYNFVHKTFVKFFLISGFMEDKMIKSNNSYDYNANYDNYVRVSTENKEEKPTDDICGKLLEGCEVPTTETNATTESDNNNLGQIYKKYLQEDSVNNATGPTTSSQEAGEPVLKQDNVTQTTAGGDQIYENSKLGIKMLYPVGWEKKEEPTADSVRFTSPREDKNDKYLQTIDVFTYPSMSMNQATESLTNYYKASLKNFTTNGSPRASVNANLSSVSLNYTYNDDRAGTIRSMDFIVSPQASDKTYLFTFRDEVSNFERDLPEVQRILDSINFLR